MTDKNLFNENNNPEKLTSIDLVRKHLQDKDHKITDEDLKNVKIGEQTEEEKEEMN